jgi:actin-related protein
MTIHAVLLDFRFRLTSMLDSNSVAINTNNKKRPQTVPKNISRKPTSVAHFLFKEEDEDEIDKINETSSVSNETANKVHERFISTLTSS